MGLYCCGVVVFVVANMLVPDARILLVVLVLLLPYGCLATTTDTNKIRTHEQDQYDVYVWGREAIYYGAPSSSSSSLSTRTRTRKRKRNNNAANNNVDDTAYRIQQ